MFWSLEKARLRPFEGVFRYGAGGNGKGIDSGRLSSIFFTHLGVSFSCRVLRLEEDGEGEGSANLGLWAVVVVVFAVADDLAEVVVIKDPPIIEFNFEFLEFLSSSSSG